MKNKQVQELSMISTHLICHETFCTVIKPQYFSVILQLYFKFAQHQQQPLKLELKNSSFFKEATLKATAKYRSLPDYTTGLFSNQMTLRQPRVIKATLFLHLCFKKKYIIRIVKLAKRFTFFCITYYTKKLISEVFMHQQSGILSFFFFSIKWKITFSQVLPY